MKFEPGCYSVMIANEAFWQRLFFRAETKEGAEAACEEWLSGGRAEELSAADDAHGDGTQDALSPYTVCAGRTDEAVYQGHDDGYMIDSGGNA